MIIKQSLAKRTGFSFRLNHALAWLLTIVALAVGQATAQAETVTYTISGDTDGQGNANLTLTASGSTTGTASTSWLYATATSASVSLPGDITLSFGTDKYSKGMAVKDGLVIMANSSTGGYITLSHASKYIYHVTLKYSNESVVHEAWNLEKSYTYRFQEIRVMTIVVDYDDRIPITDAVISGINSEYIVSNAAVEPVPTITWHGTTLTKDTHYTLNYQNNTVAGTATVSATGKGIFSTSTNVSKNYTLVWATYTIRFNKNHDSATGTMDNQTFTYSTAQNLTANAFTRTGYTFVGWTTNADGSGDSYTDGQSVSNLTAENGATVDLYAQWTASTALAQTVTVTTAEEFIAAVKNTSVTKIILGADITPPNQIYTEGSIEEDNLEETEIPNSACFVITREDPLTIDLAGHKISGTNAGTGIAKTIPTSTSASGYAAGILSLHGASVTMMDSSGGGVIKNTHNGSAYVIVANPATLVINDGITIDSTNGISYGLYVFSAGESHITINDAVITGNRPLHGYVGSKYKNSTLTINGGTFTGTGSLGIFGNGSSALTTFGTMEVNGGTFITTYENSSFFGYLGDTKFATGGTFYGFDDDNKLNQLAQLVPDDYSVKVTAKPAGSDYLGEAVYEIVPTADCDFVATRLINRTAGGGTVDFGVESGTEAGVLLGYDSSNAATQVKRIYVTDDCALNVSGFGSNASSKERYLFVDIPAGKTVTGDITMKYGTITFTGEGTFSGTVTSADESKYAIEYDAETKTYTAGVPDSELGLTVTKLNGTVKRFTKTEAGDVVRGYSYTVESGDVFKLYADISCTGSLKNYPNNYNVVDDPNYTIDLNGHELRYAGTGSTFVQIYTSSATKVSTLNLIDTSANGGGVFDGTSCSLGAIVIGYAANSPSASNIKYGGAVVVGAGVTVKGCVLVSGRSTFDLYGNLEFNTSSDMPMNSNNKWSQADQRITLHSGSTVSNTSDAAIRIPQYCTFIVEDGATVIGKNYGIEFLHGDLHIAPGAVITATDGPALKINTSTTYTLGVTVDIKGGTFTSKADVAPITSTGNSASTGKPVTGFIAPAAKGDVVLSEAISEDLLANWYILEDWENDTKTVARFRKQLSSTDITVADIPDQTYSGMPLTPEISITDGETELALDTDFSVDYSNNVNAGTATVTITGMGNYEGTVEKTFEIVYPIVTTSYMDASGTLHDNISAIPLINAMTTLAAGTYVVNNTVTFTTGITLTGNVTLILADDKTMDANGGIVVSSGNSLTIYAQSDGGSMGVLNAEVTTSDGYSAGIGGSNGQSCGTVTINGGDITAKGGYNGAGIGGGSGGSGGTIVINGGTVKAYGNSTSANDGGGAGIGGGTGGAAGNITINGGTVTAQGNWYVPGIGGGINGTGGNITINGGKVTSEGGYNGENGINGTITLGWTNATDRIYASSYVGSLALVTGKMLSDGEGTIYTTTDELAAGDIDGKTLHPAVNAAYVKADGTTATADATVLSPDQTILAEGWYIVSADIRYTSIVTLTGNVNLILADGHTMSVTSTNGSTSIYSQGYNLHIYGQTLGTGTLNAQTQDNCPYVIHISHGTFGIHGGNVSATAEGDYNGSYAIYMTRYFPNDALIIDGGTLTANGNNGNGIYIGGGNARINGGHVTATGNDGITVVGIKIVEDTFPGILTLGGGTLTASSIKPNDGECPFGSLALADHLTYTDGTDLYASTEDLSDLYSLTDVTTLRPALLDNADNGAAIAALATNHGYRLGSIALHGRTLTKDGNWNTLCLPFSLTPNEIAASPLAGATIKELDADETSLSDAGALTLKFNTVTAIEAGKPYIVKWDNGDNISNPVFPGVTISSTTPTVVESDDSKVKFVGQYSPFSITDENINSILYVASGNKIGYSSKARDLKCFRAHFWVKPNGDGSNGARSFVLDFGDGETTSMQNLTPTLSKGEGAWYSLDGRKLNKQPSTKGVYIHNGRKTVIK